MPGGFATNNLLTFQSAKISASILMFHKFDPPSLKLDSINTNTWDANGKLLANAGGAVNPLHGEWGMERICDTNGDLFTWFTNTNQQGVTAQQDNVTVTILSPDGSSHLGTWTMNNTTPIAYSQAGIDANSNAVLTESIRFYSTDITYAAGS